MLIDALIEFGDSIVGAVFDWFAPNHDKSRNQPQPVPETLYEERGTPPETGTRI